MSTSLALWDRTSLEPQVDSDPLPRHSVDVLIVGAGITGLSTALHAAQNGLSAHVVDARSIGGGASGRSAGIVNAGTWLSPVQIEHRLGDHAPAFLREFSAAPLSVFKLIEDHDIKCDLVRSGSIRAATTKSGLRELRARTASWRELGAPIKMIDADETRERTGARGFLGALDDKRAGTLNPMAYCRGMARAARTLGAGVTTGYSIGDLRQAGGIWHMTATGDHDIQALRARYVVLAVGAYADAVWTGLEDSFVAARYLQFATEPLDARADTILPAKEALWETGRKMTSVRRDRQGRIILGTMSKLSGTESRGSSARWARVTLEKLFPALGPVRFEQAWEGQLAMTKAHTPRLHNLAPRLYVPTAYNGRGITTGTVFGRLIADIASGQSPENLPVPITQSLDARSPLLERLFSTAFPGDTLPPEVPRSAPS